MKIYNIIIFVSLFTLLARNDCHSSDTLYLENYLEIVLEYHPLILRANLNEDIAAAQILKGKGALDPKVFSDYSAKQFDDTDYFTVWQSEAKIPTTLPIDLSVGYERNDGVFLNNENSVPDNGLIYGTVNLSLLRGLLYDEQRYSIQSAEIKGLKSQIEREIVTRDIIYQAINTYLDWAVKDNSLNINENYLELVNQRHQNVIQLFLNGDSPAIDTLESRLNINTAEKIVLQSKSKRIKSKQNLSLFIWDKAGQPLQINNDIKPAQLESLVRTLRNLCVISNPDFNNDPIISKIENEIRSIELENRLEKENLKPQLDLKYNTILSLGKEDLAPTFSFNDYKYGVVFQYPILNRKSKGQLRINESLSKINKLDKTEYLGRFTNKYIGLLAQEEIQVDAVLVSMEKITNSQLLYDAENLKFSLGESSVFLLNQRERKLIEAQNELIKSFYSLGMIYSELYYLKMGQL